MVDRGHLPPLSERGDAPRIAVFVEDDRDRELLVDHLRDHHEVLDGDGDDVDLEDPSFDCCLVDPSAFTRSRDRLARAKSSVAPVFLPYLLLVGRDDPDAIPPDVWSEVDEVVRMPVDPPELEKRIGNLLERRRLSTELDRRRRYSEDRFQSLFETAPDPVFVASAEGEIREVNDAFASMFDVDPDAVAGESIAEAGIEPVEEVERILVRIDDGDDTARTTLEPGDEEASLVTEINASAVRELGDVTDTIGIVRDITELKERERQLREQNERLRDFAGTISHDLRNPLEIAQGYLEQARESDDESHYDEVEEALDWMEQLVVEILYLARQGETVLEADRFPLGDVVADSLDHVEFDGDCVEVDPAVDRVAVEADRGRLRMLFGNLLRNAREHAGEEATVRIGLLPEREGFYVEDDGPGLPDDRQVFQTGFSTTDSGTGLGLSIVAQIVDGHGWTVEATESVEGGARFEFRGIELVDATDDGPGEDPVD